MLRAQLLEKLEAALRAEVDVEQDDCDLGVGDHRSRLCHRRGLGHAPALELEVDPAEKPDRRIVVDDENGVTGRVHRVRQCTRNSDRTAAVLPFENGNRAMPRETGTRSPQGPYPDPTPHAAFPAPLLAPLSAGARSARVAPTAA